MLLEETRILHHVISDFAQKNLKCRPELPAARYGAGVNDRLQLMLRYSLETFFGEKKRTQPKDTLRRKVAASQ
jgi:hypothetical protein